MHRVLVLDVVGLTPALVGRDTPNLSRLARERGLRPLRPILPAVTCSVQTTFLTGLLPRDHGVVANGWYLRDLAEVAFWKQSNHLVSGEKVWDAARRRDPTFTSASLFFWYNMYGTATWSVTPRPIYRADGLKIPDFYTNPPELHAELCARLGPFPLFQFWGPGAGLRSTQWIADCALHVLATRRPTLTLVYLPHLDYVLQREGPRGPGVAQALREIDAVCGALIEQAEREGMRWVVLSEYGITEVRGAIHVNRALRAAGLLAVRDERGHEMLDAGASEAFAVADHQIAHVYVRSRDRIPAVKQLLESLDGVERVLDAEGKREHGLDHGRAGELIALSAHDRWFTYYYWLDDARAPDFARTVDIHRKPGYDPVELFFDPKLALPRLRVALSAVKKRLGMRALLEVVPLDASLVRGSHGRLPASSAEGPLFLCSEPSLVAVSEVDAAHVKDLVLAHVFDDVRSRARDAA